MDSQKRTPTIGLLVSGITDIFTESVCKGAMHASREAGMNLVVLPGRYLDRDMTQMREVMYEYQYNTIFTYANKEDLDAVIVSAGSIGCFTTQEKIKEMLSMYEGIPCVLVASKIDGYISVNYDNDQGIREGMDYLIHTLGCKKICMLGGPDSNTDAFERKQVYLDMFRKNNLPYEDRFFVEGDLSENDKDAFVRILDNNPDAEAIFCVNDYTALGLYEEMQRRNLVPGKDIYIMGYDNTITGSQAKPSLSTVRADPIALGEHAVDLTIRLLAGEDVRAEVIPTKFVRRNSFGSENANHTHTVSSILDPNSISSVFHDIFYRHTHEEVTCDIRDVKMKFNQFMNRLLELYRLDSFTSDESEELLRLFDELLNADMLQYADVDNLLHSFEQIYHAMIAAKPDNHDNSVLLDFFVKMYWKLSSALDHRFGIKDHQNFNNAYSTKLFVRDILQFERGNDQSYLALLNNLGWLNIRNGYVFAFKDVITHLVGEKFMPPDEICLKAVLEDGVTKAVPKNSQVTKLRDIFDFNRTRKNKKLLQMVMLPLFSNEFLYGFVICDLTEAVFKEGEFLTNMLSSAARIIQLLKVNQDIQQQLESNLAALKEHNIVLDNLSKSDALTDILNRRGFFDAANKKFEANKSGRKNTLIAYADMNNLKIINDRYGHEEGDFSLKLIGQKLVELTQNSGIAGRIGGDEFAFIMDYELDDHGESILREIKDRFDAFNAGSPKPYNVTISVGTCLVPCNDGTSLEEALGMADEKLYEAKKNRIKRVAKEEC